MKGWYKNSTLTQYFDPSSNVTSNMTLYAKWKRNDGNTTINGGFEEIIDNTSNDIINNDINKDNSITRDQQTDTNTNTRTITDIEEEIISDNNSSNTPVGAIAVGLLTWLCIIIKQNK